MICLLKAQLLKVALKFVGLLLRGCQSGEVIDIAQGYQLLLSQFMDDQICDSLAACHSPPEPKGEADVYEVSNQCVQAYVTQI